MNSIPIPQGLQDLSTELIMATSTVSLATYNAQGIMTKALFVSELLEAYDIDVLAIQEHWLYPDSLPFLDTVNPCYRAIGRSDSSLDPYVKNRRGKGGIAFMVKRTLYNSITELDIDDDRILGIKLPSVGGCNIHIICIYMPCSKMPVHVYQDYLDRIQDVHDEYSSQGLVLILGDVNAEIQGPRCMHPKSPRSPLLHTVLQDAGLTSITVQRDCQGPTFTYDPYESGLNRSFIDHIMTDTLKTDLWHSCEVVARSATNWYNNSDHLPVVAKINLAPVAVVMDKCIPKLNRKKVSSDHSAYERVLNELLSVIPQPTDCDYTYENVCQYYTTISDCMHSAANVTVPCSHFNRFLKPRWSTELKPLHNHMMYMRFLWKQAGKPRGSDHTVYINYKTSKRKFTNRFNEVIEEDERSLFEEYDNAACVDANKLWAFVKRRRNKGSVLSNEVQFDGLIVRDPQEIADKWADHFDKLYTPHNDTSFSTEKANEIYMKMKMYREMTGNTEVPVLDDPIERVEVETEVRKMPLGKAGGPDRLCNEHIKYGGETILTHIWYLLQMCHKIERLPHEMKRGIIITLLKDKNAKIKTNDNHRGITLLSVLYKLYEKIILERFLKWKKLCGVTFPDPLQVAYQKQLCSLHASFNLQECITYNTERHSIVYVCLLDSSKAFDHVWHEGLFVKLYEMGVTGKSWRIIVDAYTGMQSAVRVGDKLSRYFNLEQSVRQGGVLSPWLYLLHINDLLVKLRNSGHGASVGSTYCGVVAQADDIALIALSPDSLQHMINICYSYSTDWRFKYNPNKSMIVVFGESPVQKQKQRQHRQWFLGDTRIQEADEAKHVGIVLKSNMCNTGNIDKACRVGRGTFLGLLGAGVRPNGLNPITSKHIYNSAVLPKMLYGCELWGQIGASNMLKLERTHRFCLKLIQGFSPGVHTIAVTNLMGMTNMEAIVDRNKLLFLGGLCRLPDGAVSKDILIHKLSMKENDSNKGAGFVNDICNLLEKYEISVPW